ncbi:MAG: hypothetical protein F4118_11255 [Acidimicrobiaceae bacterium]|nr:hypothetical protein [Acidimicrobiaceae bacterium]MYI36984.1 hypothetical protein [Acidimicrobiaceae bacterium]
MSNRRRFRMPRLALLTLLALACMGGTAEALTGGESAQEPVTEHPVAVASEQAASQGWPNLTTVIVSAAVAAFVSLATVLATQRLSDRSERRRLRRDVLRKLAGHRYLLLREERFAPSEFWVALNEIIIAYMDDEGVMKALEEFRSHLGPESKAKDMVPLIVAMARAARLPVDRLDAKKLTHELTHPLHAGERPK